MKRDPMLQMLGRALRPGFRFAATLVVDSKSLSIRSNVGVWSLLAALIRATKHELNAITAQDFAPACRRALNDMCRKAPKARACQPLDPERIELVRRGCARL